MLAVSALVPMPPWARGQVLEHAVDPVLRDSSSLRLEFGFRIDVSNESFFEESLDDTTFRDPVLLTTPEVLRLGVAGLRWSRGGRASRGESYLAIEGGAGTSLQWANLDTRLSRDVGSHWRVSLDPRMGYRHDRTFDRDRDERRVGAVLRAQRRSGDRRHRIDLRTWGDWLRSSGAGSEYLLDRDIVGLAGAYERNDWRVGDGRLEYALAHRAFPDSLERDHLEHRAEASLRRDWAAGGSVSLGAQLERRSALRAVFDSRDQFWNTTLQAELRLPERAGMNPLVRFESELQRYDTTDSLLYFDHSLYRAVGAVRVELRPGLALELGPEIEWLHAGYAPEEQYVESAGRLDVQWLGSGALWSITPAIGWREYGAGQGSGAIGLRSSYAFFDASLVVDQPIPGGLRVRGFGYGRYERHQTQADDARSLYFSVDVRRLF